jgi:2'-5' RNA ligase
VSLFFALWPDDDLRRRIGERRDQLKAEHKGVFTSWVTAAHYHLTVQDVTPIDGTPLDTVVRKAIAAADGLRAAPFELHLDHAAGYPGARNRYRWMLLSKAVPAELKELRRALLDGLRKQGRSPKPTSTNPHVSLHYSAGRQLPERRIEPLDWPVREFVLLAGADEPNSGFRYELLGRWPLVATSEPDHARQFDLWDNRG